MSRDESRVELLRQLSAVHRDFLVWKHLDRALRGSGDVDAAAPLEKAAAVGNSAASIAKEVLGATAIIYCAHVADKQLQFFVQPHLLPQLFELDVCTQPSRGLAPWADPASMLAVSTMSADGIRRLRPGAEGVVSLVYHGISAQGGERLRGDEQLLVTQGVSADFQGAMEAVGRLVPKRAREPLAALLEQYRAGAWDSKSAADAYRAFVLAGLTHPQHLARRLHFQVRLRTGRECVMSRLARRHHRQVNDGDLNSLLRAAERERHFVEYL